MNEIKEELARSKSNIFGLFFKERDGQISKLDVGSGLNIELSNLVIVGRLSVLREFDDICKADAHMGFTVDEWKAVQKFFEHNKRISGWDK